MGTAGAHVVEGGHLLRGSREPGTFPERKPSQRPGRKKAHLCRTGLRGVPLALLSEPLRAMISSVLHARTIRVTLYKGNLRHGKPRKYPKQRAPLTLTCQIPVTGHSLSPTPPTEGSLESPWLRSKVL